MNRAFFTIVAIGFAVAMVMAMVSLSCSDSDDETDQSQGKACEYGYECEGKYEMCIDGHCLAAEDAPKCVLQTDCPDQLHQLCIEGRCIEYECKTSADCQSIWENSRCKDYKCIPECLRDSDCADLYGADYICRNKKCEYIGGDEDIEDTAEPDEEEGFVDPCSGVADLLGCSDFANSCAYDVLTCSDYVNRDWVNCYYIYDENGNRVGQKIYFAGGDWFAQYFTTPPSFAAGKDDQICYFLRSSNRIQNEAEVLDAQGNHLFYVGFGAAVIRIECTDGSAECYRASDLMNCEDFPYPLNYTPPEHHPLTCTDPPE